MILFKTFLIYNAFIRNIFKENHLHLNIKKIFNNIDIYSNLKKKSYIK